VLTDVDASTSRTSLSEPDADLGPAGYQRPVLRPHGPLSTLTAKSGDTQKNLFKDNADTKLNKEITDSISDVNAKENIVAVIWR
jgi:hypothetical protein